MGLERFHRAKLRYSAAEKDEVYRSAYERGKALAESLRRESR
jgi:hypothetical protein